MVQTQLTQDKLKPLPHRDKPSCCILCERHTGATAPLEQAGVEPRKDLRQNASLQDHVGADTEFLGKSPEIKRAQLSFSSLGEQRVTCLQKHLFHF